MPDTEEASRYPTDLAPALAAALHSEGFPNGDRAALKRMGISGRTPLAYWRFLLRRVPERWQGERYMLGWRTLICALALQHQYPQDGHRPLGRALAELGFSEARLEGLLAAEARVLATLMLRAARRIAAQRVRCDWRDFAQLLFAFNDDSRERINERIARDFYHISTIKPTAA